MGYDYDQRRAISPAGQAQSARRDPGRGTASWQLPAVNSVQTGRYDGQRVRQNPEEWDESQFRKDLRASMDIDVGTFAETFREDIAYIRSHLLQTLLTAGAAVGVGMFISAGLGAILLVAGVAHSFYAWIAAVKAADGEEKKIERARKAYVHFLEAFILASGIRLLRAARAASAEEHGGLPAIRRPRRDTSVASTVSAGQEASKALEGPEATKALEGPEATKALERPAVPKAPEGPDPDVFDAKGRLLVPAYGGASQTLDRMSDSDFGDGFHRVSHRTVNFTRGRNYLSPAEFKRIVMQEIEPYFVFPPTFRTGKQARFIPKNWTLEFPDTAMNGEVMTGQVAFSINEVLQYWAAACRIAGSPTQKGKYLSYFPRDVALAAERNLAPLPIRDYNQVTRITMALRASLALEDTEKELAQARIDYSDPTDNFMTAALEYDRLGELEANVRELKTTIAEYADASGSQNASDWAIHQYNLPSNEGWILSASPVQQQLLRHDGLDFSEAFFPQMEILRLDWKHPDVSDEQRLKWFAELVNAQLGQWGVPRLTVVSDEYGYIDLKQWRWVISKKALLPAMADEWPTMYRLIAYQGAQILQYWKILKARRAEPDSVLELDCPRWVVAAAKAQPATGEELRHAKRIYQSLLSPERVIAEEQMRQAKAEVHAAKLAQDEAQMDFAMAGDEDVDMVQAIAAATDDYNEAIRKLAQVRGGFSQRPEERDALGAVERTLRRVGIIDRAPEGF